MKFCDGLRNYEYSWTICIINLKYRNWQFDVEYNYIYDVEFYTYYIYGLL